MAPFRGCSRRRGDRVNHATHAALCCGAGVRKWHKADMPKLSAVGPLSGGGFNRSAQHLLILRGEEVCHGDVADLVHGSAEGRAVGAMEEWAKCCGHLAGVGKEEQDWR